MNKRRIQNTAVIGAAIGAALLAVYSNTHWLTDNKVVERERCYGVSYKGKNDCASAKHACASQSLNDKDRQEFIMVPKGLCNRIVGGKSA